METAGALALILAAPLSGYLYDRNPVSIYIVSAVMVAGTILISMIYVYWKQPKTYDERLTQDEIMPG
ncbi:MAG: hypothetical protein A2W33_00830 [Chloroflexi bacterium RBG_16_52_11]|nr:MAG: hypothetical protein A2W33_00830 [Chloroflexi bacterium RBG_16_52_11]